MSVANAGWQRFGESASSSISLSNYWSSLSRSPAPPHGASHLACRRRRRCCCRCRRACRPRRLVRARLVLRRDVVRVRLVAAVGALDPVHGGGEWCEGSWRAARVTSAYNLRPLLRTHCWPLHAGCLQATPLPPCRAGTHHQPRPPSATLPSKCTMVWWKRLSVGRCAMDSSVMPALVAASYSRTSPSADTLGGRDGGVRERPPPPALAAVYRGNAPAGAVPMRMLHCTALAPSQPVARSPRWCTRPAPRTWACGTAGGRARGAASRRPTASTATPGCCPSPRRASAGSPGPPRRGTPQALEGAGKGPGAQRRCEGCSPVRSSCSSQAAAS